MVAKKIKIITRIFLLLCLTWIMMVSTDYVKTMKFFGLPVFTSREIGYNENGLPISYYHGLGYKVMTFGGGSGYSEFYVFGIKTGVAAPGITIDVRESMQTFIGNVITAGSLILLWFAALVTDFVRMAKFKKPLFMKKEFYLSGKLFECITAFIIAVWIAKVLEGYTNTDTDLYFSAGRAIVLLIGTLLLAVLFSFKYIKQWFNKGKLRVNIIYAAVSLALIVLFYIRQLFVTFGQIAVPLLFMWLSIIHTFYRSEPVTNRSGDTLDDTQGQVMDPEN